jgi:hypothetical protein
MNRMKKLLAGGAALALASVVGLASPAGGQEALTASLSADSVDPGAEIAVSSVDPCPNGGDELVHVGWVVQDAQGAEVDTNMVVGEEGALDSELLVAVEEDNSWSFTFTAPEEPGDYTVLSGCLEDTEVVIQPDTFDNPCEVELFADTAPWVCFDLTNPCEDEHFPHENPELCIGEDESLLDPCVDEEFLDANLELCFDLEGELLNPCDDEEFASDPELAELCEGDVPVCVIDASLEGCAGGIIELVTTGVYENGFTVVGATPPAPPVAGTPQLTG